MSLASSSWHLPAALLIGNAHLYRYTDTLGAFMKTITTQNRIKSLAFMGLLTGAVGLAALPSIAQAALPTTQGNALNNTLNYGILNFSASASRKVDNDQTNAMMTKVVQNRSSTEVANQITLTLNRAVEVAKKYPSVQVTTGNQSTYPQYDKNQKISGWTGNASLNLKGTDTVAMSKLIAELQAFMTLDGLSFSVSDATRRKVNQDLMIEASSAFQQQARALLPVWQARDYQLVNLDFSQGGDYGRYPVPMMMAKAENASGLADQNFQAGESTITVTATGSVQLVK